MSLYSRCLHLWCLLFAIRLSSLLLWPELADTADTTNEWMWESHSESAWPGISSLALERGGIVALMPHLSQDL